MAEQQSSNVAAGATGDQQTSTARDDMPFPLEVRYMIIKDAVFPTHDCAAHGNIRHFDALTATRVLLAYPHLVYEVLELAKDFLGIARSAALGRIVRELFIANDQPVATSTGRQSFLHTPDFPNGSTTSSDVIRSVTLFRSMPVTWSTSY